MTKNSSLVDENSTLLHNRELIILKVALEYWEKNQEQRIRYTDVKSEIAQLVTRIKPEVIKEALSE